jgi:hypothetical protein
MKQFEQSITSFRDCLFKLCHVFSNFLHILDPSKTAMGTRKSEKRDSTHRLSDQVEKYSSVRKQRFCKQYKYVLRVQIRSNEKCHGTPLVTCWYIFYLLPAVPSTAHSGTESALFQHTESGNSDANLHAWKSQPNWHIAAYLKNLLGLCNSANGKDGTVKSKRRTCESN